MTHCLECKHLQRSSLSNSGLYQCAWGMQSPTAHLGNPMQGVARKTPRIALVGGQAVVAREDVLEGHTLWPIHFNPLCVEQCCLPR